MNIQKQSPLTFEEVSSIIWKYRKDRDWHIQQPRALAISIALEANELLEHYQWSEEAIGNKKEIAEELADIFIYAIEFAQTTDIDIASAIQKKLEKAGKKYPAKAFKGKKGVAEKDAWLDIKLNYKKEGL